MDNQSPSEKPLLTLIQQLKDGQLDPLLIDKELRQQIVEIFMAQGQEVPVIAQILKVCDKTIRRDIRDLRYKNSLSPDVELAKSYIGELVINSRIHRDHLMRLARTSGVSVSEKVQAEYSAALVGFTLVSKLQSLGYLPNQPQAIVQDIFHHTDDKGLGQAFADLKDQIQDVEKSLKEGGISQIVTNELEKLKIEIKQIEEKKDEQTDSEN